MKYIYSSLACLLCLVSLSSLQAQVSHTPQNKNFLIEKGTGQVCGSCPGIAKKCDTVIESHPGRGMLIEYHFGPDATPQAGQLAQDFRTWYGDTIYEPTKLHWPFYLNMMVNRLDRGVPYGSTFIFGPNNNQVQPEADKLVDEVSPVNLYMLPTYDPTTRELTVKTEVYYTADANTDTNYLQIAITEDSIISMQYDPEFYKLYNGFNAKFNHTNVFRDNINGFEGDIILNTKQGITVSRTYKYTMPTKYRNIGCNPTHCKLTMYISDQKKFSGKQSLFGNVSTAIRSDFYGKSFNTGVAEIDNKTQINVFPNPSKGIIYINSMDAENYTVEVMDMQGRTIYNSNKIFSQQNSIDLSGNSKGIYFVKVKSEMGVSTHKVVLAD
ncbi:MAG: T9SS type A sorting domain-containing protein [Bacteroidota bacterium]|nr:T9SS type A sorting domain-containing protein [Bacteroidota bacterium]